MELRVRAATRRRGRGRKHARFVERQLERLVIQGGRHFYAAGHAVDVDRPGGGAPERLLELADDAPAECGIVTARLGTHDGAVGNHVGGLAGLDHAHVAGSTALLLLHLAMPAGAIQNRNGARRDGNRAHPAFRSAAGVARHPTHLDVNAVRAGGAHHQPRGAAAVPVEGEPRIAQRCLGHALRALQPHLLLNEPAQRDGRMRQSPLHDLQGSCQQHGAGRAVVGAQTGAAARRAHHAAAQQRLAADADRHGVQMAGQQTPRTAPRSLQLEDQVAGIAAERSAPLHAVDGDDLGRYAGRAQLAGDVA